MNLKSIPTRWKIFLVVSILSLVADQVTKYWAREALPVQSVRGEHGKPTDCDEIPDDMVREVGGRPAQTCEGVSKFVFGGNKTAKDEPSFWMWRLSFNKGSAFGLFSDSNARWFLTVVGILAVIAMVWMLKKAREEQKALIWALGFVAGGAVGNLIDRVYFGVVTDFVLWTLPAYGEWPVFNVADVALVVGVGLMFVDIWSESKREKMLKAQKKA